MNYIVQYRQNELLAQQFVEPGDPLPGSHRWFPDRKTGELRPHLANSLNSGFGYVDMRTGELHEEHVIGLRNRHYALKRRARLVFKKRHVFMLTVSHLGTDPDAVRAYVLRALAPLRALGAHWLHVIEEHVVSDDLHTHVLIHAPRDSGITRHTIADLATAALTSERSTVRVDQAITRDSAETLAAYVGKTLLSDPDGALRRNTPTGAKQNKGFGQTQGFWGFRGWAGVYRNNRDALYDPNRDAIRAAELLEDLAAASIEGRRTNARTVFTYTLFSLSFPSCKTTLKAVRAGESDEDNPKNRRPHAYLARGPPLCRFKYSSSSIASPPF